MSGERVLRRPTAYSSLLPLTAYRFGPIDQDLADPLAQVSPEAHEGNHPPAGERNFGVDGRARPVRFERTTLSLEG